MAQPFSTEGSTLMKNVKQKIKLFITKEEGLTTVEYAVAGAVVASAVLLAFTNLGTAVGTKIGAITTSIGG